MLRLYRLDIPAIWRRIREVLNSDDCTAKNEKRYFEVTKQVPFALLIE
jgi:hypothetical protein